ncbi:hypothetical protein D0T84_09400 [Dysgonomonas sp. 521]|nr:hypothetical protein [Dysgonomonas sp. 521]
MFSPLGTINCCISNPQLALIIVFKNILGYNLSPEHKLFILYRIINYRGEAHGKDGLKSHIYIIAGERSIACGTKKRTLPERQGEEGNKVF